MMIDSSILVDFAWENVFSRTGKCRQWNCLHISGLDIVHKEFLSRLIKSACADKIEPETLTIVAIILLDRYRLNRDYMLSRCSFRIMCIVAISLAHKLLSDENIENRDFATYGGYDIKLYNIIEREFLTTIEWNINVSTELFILWRRLLGSCNCIL